MENTNLSQIPLVKKLGRKKGSFSFVPLTLAAMSNKISDPNFRFLVSRKQAESLGFEGLVTANVAELQESLAGQAEETKVPVKTEEL